MAQPVYTYAAAYVRTIDGDTVVLDVDLGFRLTARLPIRLQHINAPDVGEAHYDDATAFTERWLTNHTGLIVTTQKNPEKYGRWLGVIAAAGANDTLNNALVQAGLAVPYEGGLRAG